MVVVIGLENILIIVRAVISSDPGLDVKVRVADGLYREGMALTKNLCTELFLLAIGIISFNYAMKVSFSFSVQEVFPIVLDHLYWSKREETEKARKRPNQENAKPFVF